MRHTKIIATVGPASSHPDLVAALIAAGADVFRLNFSHGTQEIHGTTITTIRRVAEQARRHVAILQDLSGPKIRTGRIRGGGPLDLLAGARLDIRIGSDAGEPGMVSTTYAPLATAVKRGDLLLLDDGKIALEVEDARPEVISTRVVDGGWLGEHKGINAPNVPLPSVGVTAKDEDDFRFGLAAGVDLVALSFVQTVDDINRARAIAADAGRPTIPVVAKLERPEAITRITEISRAADALMVARGDLGLELPFEQVPQVQKQVLRSGRDHGIPVIIATQVLESMRTESRPTRAEVSDAAGAVDAGADAIMLSVETAVGAHPVRAVEVLDAIIRDAESVPPVWTLPAPRRERPDHLPPLCDAAVTLAARAEAEAIIAITRKGRTARLLSARRPRAPIYALTGSESGARQLALWWGVKPVVADLAGDLNEIVVRTVQTLRDEGRLATPATIVVVSGSPDLEQSGANFVRLRRV
ncbi:MAG TPA: pyruvate kinase [Vicinamibacterales bacterium]|nr:pyruvate kinase [Vicinamibacterales bacterium]